VSLAADERAREAYFRRAEKQYEKEMAAIFREALDEIRVEMSKVYDKYAINGLLTKAEMTRYNRLASLEKNIQGIVSPAAKSATKMIDRLKPEEYGEAFFRTAWAIDNATGVGLDWGMLDKNSVAASLSNVFLDEAKRSFWFNADSRVRTAISNGLALGQSYPDMMKDLKGMLNKDNFEIMRVLRTELHDAQEAGTMASYDEALEQGVKGKVVWVATLDGRTRDTHQEMDGVEQSEDGMFHAAIDAAYPGDPALPASERINCRCDVRFELEGFAPEIRRSREHGIIPYQTYNEWSDNRRVFK
jgi:SPP1 gp7 family putative phage head morphogenesis protein